MRTPPKPETKVQRTLIVVGRDDVKGSLPGPCESFVQDYTGLHPIIDTFPSITQDSIFMDTLLMEMGMHYVTSGWGNWELGPRIFSMTLALDACTCQVHKAYFYNQIRPDSTWDLRVTERVVCNVPDSLIPWWTDQ
ncbi:MAG: hypothetical protein R2811_13235 [Flavobacteriales bacterium]